MQELFDYFDETLWLYSCPTAADDRPLVTKKHQTLSALSVIFPSRVNANAAGQTTTLTILPQSHARAFITGTGGLIRHASAYEIKQLNALRQGKSQPSHHVPFSLGQDGDDELLAGIELSIAYQESQTLTKALSLLQERETLEQLKSEVGLCKDYYLVLLTKKQIFSPEEQEVTERFANKLLTLMTILSHSSYQADNPDASCMRILADEIKKHPFDFLNSQCSPHEAIKAYVNQANVFLISLHKQYNLKLEFVNYIFPTKVDEGSLARLEGEETGQLESQASTSVGSMSLSAQAAASTGFFGWNDAALITQRARSQNGHDNPYLGH